MYKITNKKILNEDVIKLDIEAPLIAKKAKAGQFVIIRVNEFGERIPLTIADYDRAKGTITIIVQKVGKTTFLLCELEKGKNIADITGPLGNPTEILKNKKVAVIGGGVGCAIAYPQAKALFKQNCDITIISGFRNKNLVILEDEMKAISNNLYIVTDDGSYGEKGFVTNKLEMLLNSGEEFDLVLAIGPMGMMKAVADITRIKKTPTVISMNALMIDGTGMCGCCRVKVDGKMKFACIDGPDFDAHLVDFDEAINRISIYKDKERQSFEKHLCRLGGAK
jgi:2-polyprenylphenol hydroxylase and related flavodoxin oxidoreductases